MIPALILSCTAIDGDTLRCDGQRYRLLGIDAPELPGHCRRGRACAPGDPWASKAHLAELISGRWVKMTIVGHDRYSRSLVMARAGGRDLSCAQLRSGSAVYMPKWDDGQRVASVCRMAEN